MLTDDVKKEIDCALDHIPHKASAVAAITPIIERLLKEQRKRDSALAAAYGAFAAAKAIRAGDSQ